MITSPRVPLRGQRFALTVSGKVRDVREQRCNCTSICARRYPPCCGRHEGLYGDHGHPTSTTTMTRMMINGMLASSPLCCYVAPALPSCMCHSNRPPIGKPNRLTPRFRRCIWARGFSGSAPRPARARANMTARPPAAHASPRRPARDRHPATWLFMNTTDPLPDDMNALHVSALALRRMSTERRRKQVHSETGTEVVAQRHVPAATLGFEGAASRMKPRKWPWMSSI